MEQYLNLLKHVLETGKRKPNRTGIDTLSVFGYQTRHNLQEGFPLLTTKKLHLKSIIYELLWFLRGDSNVKYLRRNGVRIWDAWADANGDLGPTYGVQWRSWKTADGCLIDQVSQLIEQIKSDPHSRRLIISSWNVGEIKKMALPPCTTFFQFYIVGGRLSCQVYQRSADVFIGVPFDIASCSLLTMLIAQVCSLEPYELVHTFGDAHLYVNHLEQAQLQLTRKPYNLPKLKLNPAVRSIFDFDYPDFELCHYQAYPHIKAEVAI